MPPRVTFRPHGEVDDDVEMLTREVDGRTDEVELEFVEDAMTLRALDRDAFDSVWRVMDYVLTGAGSAGALEG